MATDRKSGSGAESFPVEHSEASAVRRAGQLADRLDHDVEAEAVDSRSGKCA